jgi:tRNA U54 and U55 pseudouridine synthase Pus10
MNQQTSKIETKQLPYGCSKKKLYEMYLGQMTSEDITIRINSILILAGYRKYKKGIPYNELVKFVKEKGLPKDYFTTDENLLEYLKQNF